MPQSCSVMLRTDFGQNKSNDCPRHLSCFLLPSRESRKLLARSCEKVARTCEKVARTCENLRETCEKLARSRENLRDLTTPGKKEILKNLKGGQFSFVSSF